ncbi:MerR family transcriptional regulator [Testudinibacter sp. TR-2022]|uniref:Chaperone modulatory protein CbpM n=2 Tax=Pasteurellaceae TaxID=712 RepID=A0A4R3Y9B1_9PAST|nr:chaperone modulator CbpM [Testudinibacter sp. TR-2022]KAE9526024.1 MerR family transcriptional regulator [Testudinibacter aquarius]TNG95196.1 MerR family transcriptional regulator [Pasteurellaceae bacterium UScroc12]TNG96239.1 MerR family transcriptional regulator [Pasteurellaceae bacterium USgator41]TNH01632.1 MerR family transcriptional regulator [Pasteurellaceae bacterium UScroc31]TNH02963.1 MerR family transcriptional regulator [Pasteurellaceae bacterium USgator11]TNH03669.1 MerR famil
MTEQQDIQLTFEEIVCACDNNIDWVVSVIEEEIISVHGKPQQASYSGFQLSRIRRAHRISRDFEASVPATALILQLLDELETLRKGG